MGVSHAPTSSFEMYVNDITGVCFKDNLAGDLIAAKGVCTTLLGSSAVADEKTESGRRLDIIGYSVDLDSKTVTISTKIFLSTLNGFMPINLDVPITLRVAQRLASWRSRYAILRSASQDVRRQDSSNVIISHK